MSGEYLFENGSTAAEVILPAAQHTAEQQETQAKKKLIETFKAAVVRKISDHHMFNSDFDIYSTSESLGSLGCTHAFLHRELQNALRNASHTEEDLDPEQIDALNGYLEMTPDVFLAQMQTLLQGLQV